MEGLTRLLKKIPFYGGITMHDVAVFYWHGLYEGAVTSRAASISFSFFLALFPGVIFLFTLIPFIPIDGFQVELFSLLKDIMPPDSFEATHKIIIDILTIKRGNLLWVTVLATLAFATNGTLSLIGNMALTVHNIQVRAFWGQYIAALLLTIILALILIAGISMIIFSSAVINDLIPVSFLGLSNNTAVSLSRDGILVALILISVSLLFYYGPTKKALWRLISPGSILSTLLIIFSTSLFGEYVSSFNTYNQFYGSIGTLMVIQLWIYINAIVLIAGFEFNASVAVAKNRVNSSPETNKT